MDHQAYDSRRVFRAPAHYMERIQYGIEDCSFTTFLSCITTCSLPLPLRFLRRSIELAWLLALQASWAKTVSLADTEYMHALLRAQPFWTHLISAIAIPGYLRDEGTSAYSQNDLFEDIIRLISVCSSYTSKLAYDRQGWGNTAICEDYMKVLVRAGIFDAMEHALISRMDKDETFPGEWGGYPLVDMVYSAIHFHLLGHHRSNRNSPGRNPKPRRNAAGYSPLHSPPISSPAIYASLS